MAVPSSPPPTSSRWWRPRYILASYLFLGLALIAFVLTSVILDSALSHLSLTAQRWIVLLTLVLPSTVGVIMGILGMITTRPHRLAALGSVLLNALVAAFFLGVLALAG